MKVNIELGPEAIQNYHVVTLEEDLGVYNRRLRQKKFGASF